MKTAEISSKSAQKNMIFETLFNKQEKVTVPEPIIKKQSSKLQIKELVIKQEVGGVTAGPVDEPASVAPVDPVTSLNEPVTTRSSSVVMLFQAPSADAERVYELRSGEEFTLIKENRNWYLLKIDGLEVGWGLKTDFTFIAETEQNQELISIQSDSDIDETMDSNEPELEAVLGPGRDNAEITIADEVALETTTEEPTEMVDSIADETLNSTEVRVIAQEDHQSKTVLLGARYPYSVYLGSYQSPEEAQTLVDSYGKRDITGYWARVDLGSKGIWYRVFTGAFQDKESAEQFIVAHNLEGTNPRKTPYTVLLGEYGSLMEILAEQEIFTKMGWSTYVVIGDAGQYLLYIGAFHTMVGAEHQVLALGDEIIEKSIVFRGSGSQHMENSE